MPAQAPDNEAERLRVLRELQILDTPIEQAFDRITNHLAQRLPAPVVLVSLVDEDRQWFKSCVGLDTRQTDRNSSFCAYTILSEFPLVIEDAATDPRTSGNPLVVGPPHIRAYLGFPIKVRDQNLGTLCAIDMVPRSFSQREIELVEMAALWVQREVELRDHSQLVEQRDRSSRRAHELFHHAPYPLISLKGDGTIEEINLVGKGLWEIVGSKLVEEHFGKGMIGGASIREIIAKVLREGGAASLDPIRLDSFDGAIFYLQPSVVADPADPDGLLVGLFDQTELVFASQRSGRNRRTEEFIEQREFMARLSHEMRNSVNGMLGLVELCKQSTPTTEQIGHLETCVLALKELVDDTLDYDQIMRGQLSMENHPFNLEALCHELNGTTTRAAGLKGLEYSHHVRLDSANFMGDSLRVRQVLSNLLSNSVKYTNQGYIRFEAVSLKEGVKFVVSDSGEGMTEEFQARVFEPYSQASSGGDSTQGVGLGLAIVGELLKCMGGEVELRSSLGEGSVFEVFLPLQRATREEREESVEHLPRLNLDVLVVDDNAINRTVMSAQLRNLGCRVEVAEHGLRALEYLSAHRPDLVFLDCHMPKLDGFETARQVTAEPEKYGSPTLVALTASVDQWAEQRCREAGMHHFLQKPLRFVDLCYKLKDLSGLRDSSHSAASLESKESGSDPT